MSISPKVKTPSTKYTTPFVLLFSCGLFFSFPAVAEPWVNYLGSHYREMPWAGSVRDPEGAGFFSGIYSAEKTTTLKDYISTKDIIYSPGGLGSGRSSAAVDHFMTHILLDFGKTWKDQLQKNVDIIAAMPATSGDVYWQFGNEINSRRFSETIHQWEDTGQRINAHDPTLIPYYVEYFLAPGVDAIRSAKTQGKGKNIYIVLGSLAAAANPKAQKFLDELLNYKVQGLTSPSLQGLKVYELINVISLHYIASANVSSWRGSLDSIHQKWFQKGKINAIWSTEEVGLQRAKQNQGGVSSLQVFARYMDWWQQHKMTATQGRTFFWGADQGASNTKTNDAMGFLYQQLGASSELVALPVSQQPKLSGENIEYYSFEILPSKKRLLIVFPADQKRSGKVTSAALGSFGKPEFHRLFSDTGISQQEQTYETGFTLSPGSLQFVIAQP